MKLKIVILFLMATISFGQSKDKKSSEGNWEFYDPGVNNNFVANPSPIDCSSWGAWQNGDQCELRIIFSSSTPKVICVPKPTTDGTQEFVCTWKAPKKEDKQNDRSRNH